MPGQLFSNNTNHSKSMPGQLFSKFYKPFQEHARSAIFGILRTISQIMPGQHDSFFEENTKIKYYYARSAISKILQIIPKACQVSYLQNFTNHSESMLGQLFWEFHIPFP